MITYNMIKWFFIDGLFHISYPKLLSNTGVFNIWLAHWPSNSFITGPTKLWQPFCNFSKVVISSHNKLWQPLSANILYCDFSKVVASGHNKLWRPMSVDILYCDFSKVVASGHNKLWRSLTVNNFPVTSKFRLVNRFYSINISYISFLFKHFLNL